MYAVPLMHQPDCASTELEEAPDCCTKALLRQGLFTCADIFFFMFLLTRQALSFRLDFDFSVGDQTFLIVRLLHPLPHT